MVATMFSHQEKMGTPTESVTPMDLATRVAERSGDADSCADIIMASDELAPEISWELLPLIGSDHKPAFTKLLKPSHQQTREPIEKF